MTGFGTWNNIILSASKIILSEDKKTSLKEDFNQIVQKTLSKLK